MDPSCRAAVLLMSGRFQNDSSGVAQRIVGAALAGDGASAVLQRLTDEIGGRIERHGSVACGVRASSRYARRRRPRECPVRRGPDGVHLATRDRKRAGHAPYSGKRSLRLFGWSPGSSGGIRRPPRRSGTPRPDDIAGVVSQVRGAMVLASFPPAGGEPSYIIRAAVARSWPCGSARAVDPGRQTRSTPRHWLLWQLSARRASDARAGWPTKTSLLRRLPSSGLVRVALDVKNTFGGPVQERNVIIRRVAQVREEMIIDPVAPRFLDTGQGALDDGAGVAAVVVEAARILMRFSCVSDARFGSRFSAARSRGSRIRWGTSASIASELDRIRAVLINYMDARGGVAKGASGSMGKPISKARSVRSSRRWPH